MLAADAIELPGRLMGVSASFAPGAITAICGPNGAGKSSLLSALAGLLKPMAGRVRLDGRALADLPTAERARAIGYLPQSPEIAWDMAVETLVSLGRIPWAGAPPGECRDAIEQAMVAMDLEQLRHRPVTRLSGGERARALMARVLATRPRWLLADEPLANLDLAHAATLIARFREQAAAGRGVVLVLHDLAAAMNHADRVIVIDRGEIAADGSPAHALDEATIAQVWGVEGRWVGDAGAFALSLGGRSAGAPGLVLSPNPRNS